MRTCRHIKTHTQTSDANTSSECTAAAYLHLLRDPAGQGDGAEAPAPESIPGRSSRNSGDDDGDCDGRDSCAVGDGSGDGGDDSGDV